MTPIQIEHPKLLVVEGKDEKGFFEALVKHEGLAGIQVIDAGGKDQLGPNLKALVRVPGFTNVTCVGVVRDADTDPEAAFQSIRTALRSSNLPVPHRPLSAVGGTVKVAVLIVPGSGRNGRMEELCLESVKSDPAMECVLEYLRCLGTRGVTPGDLGKASVQVFLASRPKPGLRLGEAARAGYWPWDADAFVNAKQLLTLLT